MEFMSSTDMCAVPRAPRAVPTVESIAPDSRPINCCICVIDVIIEPRSSDMPLMSPTRCFRN